jgi:ATPase subunit of ABC transporter with duplicated ATPase domains
MQTKEHEDRLEKAVAVAVRCAEETLHAKSEEDKEAARTRAEETAMEVNKYKQQLEQRDREIAEKSAALQEALDRYRKAVEHMAHATMDMVELMKRRSEMRAHLWPFPGAPMPDGWRIVVVAGPAGAGKSSFVRELLDDLNYPGEPCGSHNHQPRLHAIGCWPRMQLRLTASGTRPSVVDCAVALWAPWFTRSHIVKFIPLWLQTSHVR